MIDEATLRKLKLSCAKGVGKMSASDKAIFWNRLASFCKSEYVKAINEMRDQENANPMDRRKDRSCGFTYR